METALALHLTTIMLGVEDVARSKAFYSHGLGDEVTMDYPGFVQLSLGEGSSLLTLYAWDAAAQDAGVSPEGSGFRGVSFHYIVETPAQVDETMNAAVAAGGTPVKPAAADWGGSFGYFADPDRYLWRVACQS